MLQQPQRMGIWSARLMTTPTQSGSYAREITPIVAKDKNQVLLLIWNAHQEFVIDEIPGIQTLSNSYREIKMRERFEIKLLTDGVWATKEYITPQILTPFG